MYVVRARKQLGLPFAYAHSMPGFASRRSPRDYMPLILLTLIFASEGALACTCSAWTDFKDRSKNADIILLVEVVDYEPMQLVAKVVEVIKGDASIGSIRIGASFCPVSVKTNEMVQGVYYVIPLSLEPAFPGNDYGIAGCGESAAELRFGELYRFSHTNIGNKPKKQRLKYFMSYDKFVSKYGNADN